MKHQTACRLGKRNSLFAIFALVLSLIVCAALFAVPAFAEEGNVRGFVNNATYYFSEDAFDFSRLSAQIVGADASAVKLTVSDGSREYQQGEVLPVGVYTVSATDADGNPLTGVKSGTLTVLKSTSFDFSRLTLKDAAYSYESGRARTLALSGLPKSVTVKTEYAEITDGKIGTYAAVPGGIVLPGSYSVRVTVTSDSYEIPGGKAVYTAKLTISLLDADMSGVVFEDRSVEYDGNPHFDMMYISTLPSDPYTVTYTYSDAEGNTIPATELIRAGKYHVTAHFTMKEGYAPVDDMTATLTVVPAVYDTLEHPVPFADKTVTYAPGVENQIEGFDATLEDFSDFSIAYYLEETAVEATVDAGIYTAKVTLSPDYEPLTYTLTVLPCPISPVAEFNDDTVLYDGLSHTLSIEGDLPENVASVSYLFSKGGKMMTACINAGEYTVTAVFKPEKNYVIADDYVNPTATLTVDKIPISEGEIEINFANGDSYVPDVARMLYISGHREMGYEILPAEVTAIDGNGDPIELTAIIYPGDYSVSFVFKPDANHAGDLYSKSFSFTVLPSELPIGGDFLTEATLTYSESPLTAEMLFDGIDGISGMTVSDLEMSDGEGGWTPISAPNHVGRYRVKALITPAEYYCLPEDVSATEPTVFEFSVVPMEISPSGFTVDNAQVPFGTSSPEITVSGTIPTCVTGFRFRYERDGVIIVNLAGAPVGEYSITAIPILSPDYVLSADYICQTATLTVVKKAISPIINQNPVSFDYTGKAIKYTMTKLPEFVTDVKITYMKDGAAVAAIVDAGVYTLSFAFETDGNHVLAANYKNPTLKLTVLPVAGNFDGVKFEDKTVTFDPSVKPDIKLSKVPTGYTVSYDMADAFHVGTYTVTATLIPDENHTAVSPMTATLTVVPKEYKVSSFTFTDKEAYAIFGAKTIKINGVAKDVSISYSAQDENGKAVNPDKITKVGTYKIFVTVTPASPDYTPTVLTATLTMKSPIGFFIAFLILLILAAIIYLVYLFVRKQPDSPNDLHYNDSALADREALVLAAKAAEENKKLTVWQRMKKFLLPQKAQKAEGEKPNRLAEIANSVKNFFANLFAKKAKEDKPEHIAEKPVEAEQPVETEKPEQKAKSDDFTANGKKTADAAKDFFKKLTARKEKAPKTEEPKVEEPKAEEPKTEEPKAEEPKTEEPKVEVPKVEEPKVEEPKAEEPKVEEPKVEEPVIEEKADDFDENAPLVIEIAASEIKFVDENTAVATAQVIETNNEKSDELSDTASEERSEETACAPVGGEQDGFAHYRTSFMSRLIQADDEIKGYYSVAKNALMRYAGVKARTSWNFESFNSGRIQLAKLNVKGRVLQVCLALNPKEYSEDKYHFSDVSDKPKLGDVPMMLKVKSERGLKYAVELIDELMEKNGIERGEEQNVDYRLPYESNDELLKKDLIKVTYSEEARPE